MNAANITQEFRFMLWREAFQIATIIDGLNIVSLDGNLRHNMVIGMESSNVSK
jgi:hypothetical protein